jgi:hypothetical protein
MPAAAQVRISQSAAAHEACMRACGDAGQGDNETAWLQRHPALHVHLERRGVRQQGTPYLHLITIELQGTVHTCWLADLQLFLSCCVRRSLEGGTHSATTL